MVEKKDYSANQITVLEGLGAVRKKFDVVELSKMNGIISPFIPNSMSYKIGEKNA